MSNRLFVALELPPQAKEFVYRLLGEIDPKGKIKWETFGKLHVTLKFLGETEKEKTAEVKAVLENFVENKNPLELKINRFGFFKRNGKPQILWAGFERNDAFEEYFSELDERLEKIGFEKEKRKFHPHVTLKRLKGNEDEIIIEKFLTLRFEPFEFIADTVTLFKSELKPNGAIYKAVEKYNLGDKNG